MQIRAGPRSILAGIMVITALTIIGATALGPPGTTPAYPTADVPEALAPAILEIPEITFDPVFVNATPPPIAERRAIKTSDYVHGSPPSRAAPVGRSRFDISLTYNASVVPVRPRSRDAPVTAMSGAVASHAYSVRGPGAGLRLRI